jgi:hypothetical protein
LIFWPGSVVTVNKSVSADVEAGNVVEVGLNGNPLQIANQCSGYGAASPGGYTVCLASITTPNDSVPNQTATLLTEGGTAGGGMTQSKGRLNFSESSSASIAAHHIITLIDSQPDLTRATTGYRPLANANDTWIGTDMAAGNLSSGRLAFGSPVSISNYIANVGDNTNWLERLSASLKEFNVATKFDQSVTVSGSLVLPQGNGYVPPVGGFGVDTAAGLPVVNIGGTTHQVALTSSNISGQAGTALALAAVPTQCSGSFATGIAANGNANCATADVIQLAETTAPTGIPGWGEFWFDSTYHAPFFIDNNGQAVQLGLTNLFNSDPGGDKADNLEERNGSNAENLRVYSSYLNSGATWQRISLGYDAADGSGYAVLRSENSTSASAPGLGFWIGSGLKWVVDAAGNLKPWPVSGLGDNQFNIGSDSGNAVKSIFANTSFNMNSNGRQDFEFANDGTNGTTLNQLAVYNSAATGVQTAATSSMDGVVGIISGGAGTSNKAVITWAGLAACNFDAANPIAGDYVIASATQAGKCHDTGSTTRPTGVQVIGRIENGEVRVSLGPPSGGGGTVSSVFGRTGAVTAANGDYSAYVYGHADRTGVCAERNDCQRARALSECDCSRVRPNNWDTANGTASRTSLFVDHGANGKRVGQRVFRNKQGYCLGSLQPLPMRDQQRRLCSGHGGQHSQQLRSRALFGHFGRNRYADCHHGANRRNDVCAIGGNQAHCVECFERHGTSWADLHCAHE